MALELDKSQKEIQKAVREFAKGKFDKELIIELAQKGQFPERIWAEVAELGFSGIHYPESLDGGGMGLLEYVLVAEELCRRDSTMGMAMLFAGFGAECIFRFGETPLAEKYLPPVIDGRVRSTAALFENGFRHDFSVVDTTAVADGTNWIINGKKAYVPNGSTAGFYIVLCHTDPDAHPTGKGLSLIVVDGDQPGISAEPVGPTLGNNLIDFAHITFENVKAAQSNLLNKNGAGYGQALHFVDENRIQLAAMALGTAQGAFDRALDYVKQREQFGRKLANFQVTRHKLADMAARIDGARWTVYQAAGRFDKKKCDPRMAATAKLNAASTALAVTDEAVQLLGGYGYMTEYEIEHFYRDAKTLEIFMGTASALKDIIADSVIGKLK